MPFSINQFSLGIKISKNNRGQYVSGGFYGDEVDHRSYPVPRQIEQEVKQGLFTISDGYPPKSGEIALIARDLGNYCVLAVANRLEDFADRPFVGYRYFWLDKTQFQNHPNGQNVDGIGTLLWYWQQKGQPQYNIEELQTNRISYTTSWDNLQQPWLFEHWQQQHYQRIQSLISDIRPSQQPLIYEATEIGGQLTYQEVHCLAIQYCTVNPSYINWAWNVRRLENLNNLNVIYCADAQAFQWFNHQLSSPIIRPTPTPNQTPQPISTSSLQGGSAAPNPRSSLKSQKKNKQFINFSIPDGESIMRIYLYIISGIFSAIIGWSLSQFVWLDIGKLLNQNQSALDAIPLPPPDIILLPIIAASLAVAMVITQILVSNPTKHRLNWREIFSINPARNRSQILPHFWLAIFCGLGAGLFSAVLAWWLYGTNLSGQWVRGICWVVVGLFVGLGEGLSWRSRSMESETQRANQRLLKTLILGGLAGLIATFIVEIVRIRLKTLGLAGYEDVISFAILGGCLGLGLSVAASPSYAVALRAGAGFEMTEDMQAIWNNPNADLPRIMDTEHLKFLTEDDDPETPIEENLSILLPYYTKKDEPIIIGSDAAIVDIYLPGIPAKCAALSVDNRKVKIKCLQPGAIQVDRALIRSKSGEKLRHGQIITFLRTDKPNKHYCFCFYDTLYDPQS